MTTAEKISLKEDIINVLNRDSVPVSTEFNFICFKVGVSRPVREAIRELQSDGHVEVTPGAPANIRITEKGIKAWAKKFGQACNGVR